MKTQQQVQRVATNVMMDLPWREEGQWYVEQMAAGIPFQTAGHEKASLL